MYLIIVEGTDNIGKDTLINELVKLFNSVTLIHCNSPKAKCFQSYEQDNTFIQYAKNIVNGCYDNTDVIIMNRSHIGEYVYGQIYRNRSNSAVYNMIKRVDNILLSREDLIVKYVQLLSSSIELRKKYDDNLSLSKVDDELMKRENDLFLEIFDMSDLDKEIFYVNDEDGFLPKEDIYNDVVYFINK